LETRGYVQHSEANHRYSLGVRLFELGAHFQNQLDIRRAALPELTSMVEETGQAGFLCVRDGDHAHKLLRDYLHVTTDTKPSDRQQQFGFTVGGPIKRNKVFFFAGFDQHIFHVPSVVKFLDGSSTVTPQAGTGPFTPGDYEAMVRAAQVHIERGDVFQMVPSQLIIRPTAASAFSLYRALRAVNPSPYMVFCDLGDRQIVSASPETIYLKGSGFTETSTVTFVVVAEEI
jgi:hypothetical protein